MSINYTFNEEELLDKCKTAVALTAIEIYIANLSKDKQENFIQKTTDKIYEFFTKKG